MVELQDDLLILSNAWLIKHLNEHHIQTVEVQAQTRRRQTSPGASGWIAKLALGRVGKLGKGGSAKDLVQEGASSV